MRDDHRTADGAATLEQAVLGPCDPLEVVAKAVGIESFIANQEICIAVYCVRAAFGRLLDDALGKADICCEVVGYHADFGERVRIGKHRSLTPCSALDRVSVQLHVVATDHSAVDAQTGHVSPVCISNTHI